MTSTQSKQGSGESPSVMKVYELAKELGVDSISLLDKLSGLNIKVKHHMSELGSEEIRIARSSLGKKETAPAKKAAAKTVTKKAATKTAASATTTTAAAPKTTTTRKKAAAAAEPKAEVAEPVEAKKDTSASTVIRRRTKSDGETETTSTGKPLRTPVVESPAEEAAQYADAAHEIEQEPFADEAHEEASMEMSSGEAVANASMTQEEMLSPEAAPGVKTRAPIIVPQRPVAPRRSILKIVEVVAPPQRPMVKAAPSPVQPKGAAGAGVGAGTAQPDGFRIIKMNKESLDAMVEEEAKKKRGGGRENDIRPEDVRFADYRKKEMVFLPRKKKIPLGKEVKKTAKTVAKASKRIVEMQENISIHNFADQLGVKGVEVVRKLMAMGQMVTINSAIDFDTATSTKFAMSHSKKTPRSAQSLTKKNRWLPGLQSSPSWVTLTMVRLHFSMRFVKPMSPPKNMAESRSTLVPTPSAKMAA